MFTSNGTAETEEAGAQLAQALRAGDILALVGDLGAGKTRLVKGIARGLGSREPVTSPTFTLIHEYGGGCLPLYHFDFYRLENFDALRGIGFDEYVFSDGISVIEWADRFPQAIPARARWIKINIISGNSREIDFGARESPPKEE